jgi:microcin C transport system substrate-binding protein
VPDWWGANLPVSVGTALRHHPLRIYRDRDVAFEGFTGKNYLFREEHTRALGDAHDPRHQGRPQARTFARRHALGLAGRYMNTRRAVKDRRLREALNYAFDFEWTNKTIMYGSRAGPSPD